MNTTDQLGHKIEIQFPPRRIISLVPSQTELLFDLGLDEQIVGVTRFCVHPAEKVVIRDKVGGTKRFDFEKIRNLKPDLIIGNKEENYLEGIEQLKKEYPVWMSDIFTLKDALAMIEQVSALTGREKEGRVIVSQIERAFKGYRPLFENDADKPTAGYLIWRRPYMAAAKNTFIDSMLGIFGVKNAFAHLNRYPEITLEMLSAAKADYIFLSNEPYPFRERHIAEFQLLSPNSKIMLVDGEMFSWYGSRLRLVPAYFEKLAQQLAGG